MMILIILLKKLDDDIESTLLSIRELRDKSDYLNKEDEFFSAIKPRIISLTKRISAKYIDRDQIVNYLAGLDGNKDCWVRLDEECREDMLIAQKLIWMLIYIIK